MDEQIVRALAAVQMSSMDAAASARAWEKLILALVALHPDRKALIALTSGFLGSDAILQKKGAGAQDFVSSYLRHGQRLLSEMRDIQATA